MSHETLNVGALENDGTGDNLRDAMIKIESNINHLFEHIGIGVFAVLSEPALTDITATNVYQPIEGTFVNDPSIGFGVTADPAIQYLGEEEIYFEMDVHVSVWAAVNNTTVTGSIKKNGNLLTGAAMNIFCKTATDVYAFSGTYVTKLAQNDKIQLVVKTNNGADVTFTAITTTIRPFIIQ